MSDAQNVGRITSVVRNGWESLAYSQLPTNLLFDERCVCYNKSTDSEIH